MSLQLCYREASQQLWSTVRGPCPEHGLLSRYGRLEFSSLGSGVVALEGVDTEAPSAGAGGADGAASLAGAFVLQCGGGGVDGGASSFAGALVGDAMGDLYSPSAVAFGGVHGDSFAVAFETSVVDGDQHGAVTGSAISLWTAGVSAVSGME